jgi:hypothetical protein
MNTIILAAFIVVLGSVVLFALRDWIADPPKAGGSIGYDGGSGWQGGDLSDGGHGGHGDCGGGHDGGGFGDCGGGGGHH